MPAFLALQRPTFLISVLPKIPFPRFRMKDRFWRAKRPFVRIASRDRKRISREFYSLESGLGEGAPSCSQWKATTSMLRWLANIGAFVAAAFHPARVASVNNVTSFRTRRRQRRRISRYIVDSAGCRTWRDSNHSKRCYAPSRGIACSANRKNRMLRVRDYRVGIAAGKQAEMDLQKLQSKIDQEGNNCRSACKFNPRYASQF